MHRFYADSSCSSEDSFVLSPGDTQHAAKVLRLRPGDSAEVVYREQRYLCVFTECSLNAALLRPVQLLASAEPALAVTLFQGLPKGDKMDWIVQKAVELGVYRIVPVLFSRCVSRPSSGDVLKKTERWNRIAREAGKQSGRSRIPEVAAPVPVSSLQPLFRECSQVVCPWEECREGGPLAFFRSTPSLSSLGIVIGPEGGITPEEAASLQSSGAKTITLGKRILRTETAGLAAISVFLGLYGEME